ncbi:Zn-ribbon domain-containing OB-fold protein [Actinomadura sp. CNU-125]|uniref:Zn-ribbon domain-containing OB-fold protein n=1 Tax=Actinomadura sp. CNU-125 TaxID=1904961 RepID=UPI0021CC7306|nr:zinc ribbon domain-containing protein [Actinomadura sp. CNU-125]
MDATMGIPPAVTEETEAFWKAAAEGRLLIEHCPSCGAESFPARGMCRSCRARETTSVEVTGRGRVYSFTVNHQRCSPTSRCPTPSSSWSSPTTPACGWRDGSGGAHPRTPPSA